ncbi:MAG: hypothetical protein CM15mV32_1230 [Caudoviricetes sp.]|nr:MAG: hypothetical protein CM15mV32_1230 [Caudoviricetes sp.]
MSSGIEARVKEWDTDTRILKISNVGIGTTQRAFIPGETIQATESTFFNVGSTTSAVVGVTTTIFTGINTSGINLNQELNQLKFGNTVPVIGSGSTVTSIGAGTITISSPIVKYYWNNNCSFIWIYCILKLCFRFLQ